MTKDKVENARELIARFKKTGFAISPPIIIRPETGQCKAGGCDGTVGTLWPLSLDNIITHDGKVAQVILAYPCDKCGALHGTPKGEEIIEDRQENQVFYVKKKLVYKNKAGKVIRADNNRLRAAIDQ